MQGTVEIQHICGAMAQWTAEPDLVRYPKH